MNLHLLIHVSGSTKYIVFVKTEVILIRGNSNGRMDKKHFPDAECKSISSERINYSKFFWDYLTQET